MSATVKKFDANIFGPDLACDPFTQILRIFTYFLQSLFEHEEFRGSGLFWNKDESVTEMIVTAEKPRLEALEKTPHITVVLGSSQWGNIGHDQMQSKKIESEDRIHTDLVSSTVSFHCQGREGLHCRRMAWYASEYTIKFRRMLMRGGGLHQVGTNHSISAESGPTAYLGKLASEELVSVVVTVPFYWQPQWRIQEPRTLLEKMETTLKVRGFTSTPLRLKGRPAYSIPIGEFGSFQELEESAQGGDVAFEQSVLSTED